MYTSSNTVVAPKLSFAAQKINALTGLRFFAAFAIMLAHTDNAFGNGSILSSFPLHQAVSFFFILSGFILSHRYLSFDDQTFPSKAYFLSRFWKLWPMHILCIVFLLVAIPSELHRFTIEPNYILAGILNIFLLQSWLGKEYYYSSLNGVAWSISCEVLFYLLFPLIRKKITTSLLLTIFVVTIALVFFINSFETLGIEAKASIYTHPVVRVFEFCLGIYSHRFAVIWFRNRKPLKDIHAVSGLALVFGNLMVCQWVFDHAYSTSHTGNLVYWFYCAGGCFAFALMIVVFYNNGGAIGSACSSRLMMLLGESSFALYMLHAIVIGIFAKYIDYWSAFPLWYVFAIVFIVSIALSVLVYYFFEVNTKIVFSEKRAGLQGGVKYFLLTLTLLGLARLVLPDHRYLSKSQYQLKTANFEGSSNFVFERGLSVDGFSYKCQVGTNRLEIELALHATRDINTPVAWGAHVVDENGEILSQVGKPLMKGSNLIGDSYWIERFVFPKIDYAKMTGVRLAVFTVLDNQLEQVTGTKTEWGGRAAQIPLVIRCPQPKSRGSGD